MIMLGAIVGYTIAFVLSIFVFSFSYRSLYDYLMKYRIKTHATNSTLEKIHKIEEDEVKLISSNLNNHGLKESLSHGIIAILFLLLVSYYAYSENRTNELTQNIDLINDDRNVVYGKLNSTINSYNILVDQYNESKSQYDNELAKTQLENVGAVKPPYTLAKGREFKTVFKKQDGTLVTWTWQASEFENAFAKSFVKLYVAPNFLSYANARHENLVIFCKVLVTSIDFAYNQYCDDAIANDKNYISTIAGQTTNFFTLSFKDGNNFQVIDYTEYVDSNTFKERITDVYDPKKSDEENIREIWNVAGQLTAYSFDLRGVPRHPLETLSEGGADCGGLSVLVASMLKAVPKNWKVEIIYLDAYNPTNPKEMNHMIVHVDTGKYSTYIEATSNTIMNPYTEEVNGWAYKV